MKPDYPRVLWASGRSMTLCRVYLSLLYFFTIPFLLMIPSVGQSQHDIFWTDFMGGSGACPNNGSITYHNLTNNPVSTSCIDVSVSTSGASTCESGVIRSQNGGLSDVLNLSLQGAIGQCSNMTLTFSQPVYNLEFTLLDIDDIDQVETTPGWDFVSPIAPTVSGSTLIGPGYDCGSGGGSCNADVSYDGPITSLSIELCYSPSGNAGALAEISISDLIFDTNPVSAGDVRVNGSLVSGFTTVPPCGDYTVEAENNTADNHC